MRSVEESVAAERAEWPDGRTPRLVFGTDEPDTIAQLVDGWCVTHLGAAVRTCDFYWVSVGCVLGLRLRDGSNVVVKAYQPRYGGDFLTAVQTCQRDLVGAGVPCPAPLAAPATIGAGLAMAETMEADTGPWPPLTDHAFAAARRASARGLAAVAAALENTDAAALAEHPLDTNDVGLYPEPHSPDFDFSLDTAGAEWIDELAREAVAIRAADTSPRVIGHSDWSARNVRLGPDPSRPARVVMAYDWDSLSLLREAAMVGQAAQGWCATGEPNHPYPPIDVVAGFVHDYEEARGTPFTRELRRAIGASALWLLCYSARCEHSIASRWPDHPDHPTVARERLERSGTDLFAI